jgi:hypothetical protein
MDHYVLRVYRRDEDSRSMLLGLVMEIGGDGGGIFTSIEELWEILNPNEKMKRQVLTGNVIAKE